jgi:hypothetical protein
MTVLSYVVPAALMLALSWGVVKLTRMPICASLRLRRSPRSWSLA